ncbi:glycosyltransferase, partial [Agreia sp.]|uniref:glycosyltransferase n=1 Tax=Agreia sp. TaxID=1872416 RepID=UPI0035BC3EAC
HRVSVAGRNVTYRAILSDARAVRGVVAGLASTNVETYLMASDPRVDLMLWGHGRNFTAKNNALDGRLERWLSGKASHVFAYTDQGRRHLVDSGLAPEKVSTVVNSTDVATLRRAQASATEAELAQTRADYDLDGKDVALFVGAFDEPKRLPFLFEAADRVARQNARFRLLLAGAGPLDAYVGEQVSQRDYARTIGRKNTEELASLSNLVDLIVMPGRVGLVAVDSLALGVPLATTSYPFHAPESEYLNRSNSIWSDDDPQSYASSVSAYFASPELRQQTRERARADGAQFSLEKSADVFVRGIMTGLSAR